MRCDVLLFVLGLFWASQGLAQLNDPRQALIESYQQQRSANPSIYQSAPIYHIVPDFNTITYAGRFEELNLTIEPESVATRRSTTTSLSLEGYELAPYLALSLKSISLGFAVLRSKREASYLAQFSSGFEQRQKTRLETSGIGFNLGFLPFESLHKKVKFATIVAVDNLSTKHSLSTVRGANGVVSIDEADLRTFRYSVNRYALGLNVTWQVFPHFSMIPWADYQGTDLRDGKSAVSKDASSGGSLQVLADNDWKLFFLAYPKIRYGLDFGIQFLGLDLRIGGALGAMASLNNSVDYISDKSLQLSVSIDQKGN